MKIITIVGARPQFIKAAPFSREIRKYAEEIIIHTGQHYDKNMSDIFFEELHIPRPKYNLAIGSGNHGKQTGEMLEKIEEVLLNEKPDAVLVYGDTNSTLAGALAASKLLIPVIHIEAGLRSFNKAMPEEQNRILTDHISELLFCPTETAVNNLEKESIKNKVFNVGDIIYDAVLYNIKLAEEKSNILQTLNLKGKEYILATIHRAENTNSYERMKNIVEAFNKANKEIVLPLHPRTIGFLKKYDLSFSEKIKVIEPVGYLDMLLLEKNASKILTDSGGVQKEAYFLDVPCITMRDETEWIETVNYGWNILVGADYNKILSALENEFVKKEKPLCFGDGNTSKKISEIIMEKLNG